MSKISYNEAHLTLCREIENKQCHEDERIGSLYGERDVIFPFSDERFVDFTKIISNFGMQRDDTIGNLIIEFDILKVEFYFCKMHSSYYPMDYN